jgi:hypothetical protein
MAKMSFPNVVKYNGVCYNARVPFTVKESDVDELRKKGGWVIEEPKATKPLANTATKVSK